MRNTESVVGVVGSLRVHVRSEQLYSAFRSFVCFQSFKHFLSVVEYNRGRVKRNRSIRHDAAVVPAVLRIIIHDKHVVSENCTESETFGFRFFTRIRVLGYWKIVFHFSIPLFVYVLQKSVSILLLKLYTVNKFKIYLLYLITKILRVHCAGNFFLLARFKTIDINTHRLQ